MRSIKAEIEFEAGRVIRLDLYPELAPITVANFVRLAESGYYDGLIFHRVIPGFMVQGGGFRYDKGLVPAPKAEAIKGEFLSNGIANAISHEPGVVSMADCKFLDGEYAAFGRTSDEASLKTAVAMSKVRTHSEGGYDDIPDVPVVIKTVRIVP